MDLESARNLKTEQYNLDIYFLLYYIIIVYGVNSLTHMYIHYKH